LNTKLRHQAIQDSFATLKKNLDALHYYQTRAIIEVAEHSYHREANPQEDQP